MNNLVGNFIGKYELIRLLGHGGMAEVYEAFQPGTERSVAIKVLRGYSNETPESIARFKREARSIAQLRHTNIIQVFDFDIDEALYYMVMEYIRGGTLSQYIKERSPLPPLDAVRITIQLADALDYAHQHGVIHRDIKPVNILFTDAQHTHPVLTDFGIARILGETALTSDGRFMGSPAYLSPEVARGKPADARSDIYGLGLTMYEMLTGRMPFMADGTTSMVMQHMVAPLPAPRKFNPDVPQALEIVLSKALAKNPERRYQTAQEFKLVLRRVEESLTGKSVGGATPNVGAPVMPADGQHDPLETPPLNPLQPAFTDTMPFDEPALTTTVPAEEEPRRRRQLLAIVFLLLLVGVGGYMLLSGNKLAAGGDPSPTANQQAIVAGTDTSATSTPSPTLTLTSTPEPSATLEPSAATTIAAPVREGGLTKPTAAPTDTPSPTLKASATSQPRPTQSSAVTQPTNPPPAQPTSPPPSNPVDGAVNTVAAPVGEIIHQIIPTICILNC